MKYILSMKEITKNSLEGLEKMASAWEIYHK